MKTQPTGNLRPIEWWRNSHMLPLKGSRAHLVWLIAAAALSLIPSSALAAGGAVSTFPVSGKPSKSGLKLQVDPSWVESNGYRPVWVTAKSITPAIADRSLTITLTTNTYGYRTESDVVSANLELPTGATSARVVVPVPQFGIWTQLQVAVAENGQKIEDLSGILSVFTGFAQNADEMAVLHVSESAAATDADAFYGHLSQSVAAPTMPNGQPQSPGTPVPQGFLTTRMAADMPEEWIDLTALDFVVLSTDEMALMARTAPRAWRAVRDWTAAGGNLCIYAVGDRFERLAEIDGCLGDLPPTAAGEKGSAGDTWADCDRSLLANLEQTVLNAPADLGNADAVEGILPPRVQSMLKDFAARMTGQAGVPLRSRAFRLGRVVAWTSTNPFTPMNAPGYLDSMNQWHWVRASLGPERCSWAQRHGLSLGGENPEFWNLLIPGVGLPPVNTYRVLITLFVVLIGPVNYLVLKRLRRLHYLLFIVPASAALVTAALLGYALISDGLSVRLRARSYTLLDQRSGQAVTWSRLSYYAGLSPYGGLAFRRDTAVYPFDYEQGSNSSGYLQRTTAWDDEQHLARGWLSARTLTQFLAVRCAPERKRLEITPDENAIKVANHLQVKIDQAVISDRSGRLYHLTGLAPGQTAVVKPLAADSNNDGTPIIPSAFTVALVQRRVGEAAVPPGPTSSLLGTNQRYYYTPPRSVVNQGSSLLEQSLRGCDHTNSGSGPAAALAPGTYLAIVDAGDPALCGFSGAVEQGSLHVIEGKW